MSKKKPLIELYAYAFMPNHYHFLLKEIQDNGVIQFIGNFQNSFAKYFNTKFDRNGSLFQNAFKGKWIESDEECLHVSRYIHLNPVTAFMIEYEDLGDYAWTSFPEYEKNISSSLITTSFLLNMFSKRDTYSDFVKNQADYQRTLDSIKHLIME